MITTNTTNECDAHEFKACDLSIFCNNIDGFLSKRHKFPSFWPYALVEPVVKNKDKLDKPEGWRLVWKATSVYEKGYDLLRSMALQAQFLNNDAYCANRSTQKALAITVINCLELACSWR